MELNDRVGFIEEYISDGGTSSGNTGSTSNAGICQVTDDCPSGYYCDLSNPTYPNGDLTDPYGVCKSNLNNNPPTCRPQGEFIACSNVSGLGIFSNGTAVPGQKCPTYTAPYEQCGSQETCPPRGTFVRCTGVDTQLGPLAEFSDGLQDNGICDTYTAIDNRCLPQTGLCENYLGQPANGYRWEGQVNLRLGFNPDTSNCVQVLIPTTTTTTQQTCACNFFTEALVGTNESNTCTSQAVGAFYKDCNNKVYSGGFGIPVCNNPFTGFMSYNGFVYDYVNGILQSRRVCENPTTTTTQRLQTTTTTTQGSAQTTTTTTQGIVQTTTTTTQGLAQTTTTTTQGPAQTTTQGPAQTTTQGPAQTTTTTTQRPVQTTTQAQLQEIYVTPRSINFQYEKNSFQYPSIKYFSVVNPSNKARQVTINLNSSLTIEPAAFTLPPQTTTIVRISPVNDKLNNFSIGKTSFVLSISAETIEAPSQIQNTSLEVNVNVTPFNAVPINFSVPIINAAYNFVDTILNNYFDEDRELKTLLNFGEDRQIVILNKRYGNQEDSGAQTLQVKLLQPLQPGISVGDSVFISRELSKTAIDSIRVKIAPEIDNTPYLRPPNTSVHVKNTLGTALNNITLKLLQTNSGSVGTYTSAQNYSFEDDVYRKWYSFDFKSTELNIDFSNYENFVFYGSAAMRLEAFKLKLLKLEELERKRQQFSGNVFTGTLASTGAKYILEQSQKYSSEKENLIRSFDRYEQYLYFTPSGSNSPYSASFDYVEGGTEYNNIGYWPKDTNNNIISPTNTIAKNWYTDQLAIAQRFDEYNENNLVNTIPTHVREDELSAPYITFVTMVGHFFDLIKPYVDQYPYIYDRYINPDEKLSKDLITDIADAVGFKLPSFNTTTPLAQFFTTTSPQRDKIVEIQKRILHNLAFFVKAKGSKSALNALLRATGIPESILTVRESGPSATNSYYVFNEFSTGLYFTGSVNNYIILPLSSSNRTPRSIQLNVSMDVARNTTLLTGDNKWALHIKQHPTNRELGRFELTSGSSQTLLLSSSYEEIFTDELINVTIRTYNTGSYTSLFVAQTYGEDIIFSSSMQEPIGANKFEPLWSATQNLYVGGSGSLSINNFDGTIDEIRYWGINLSDDMTMVAVFDPGSNSGDKYTDPVNYLYGQISFNKVDTTILPTLILNESPYYNINNTPSLSTFQTTGFTTESFIRYNRMVRQPLSTAGSSAYLTTKIKIAPPPQFNETLGNVKQLYRTKSIVTVNEKARKSRFGNNKVIVATSPTEIINQNIVRSLGTENINVLLGAPSNNVLFETAFKQLKKYYEQYYYVDVNFNRYTRILSKLNSVLTDVINYFIPSRATTYNGIVIEPNILDKTNISLVKKLRLYGANTRKTINAASSLTGSSPDYEATFNLTKNIQTLPNDPLSGTYPYYTSSISTNVTEFKSDYNTYDLQHLNWNRYIHISQSFVSGTAENVKSPYSPWPKVKIDSIQEFTGTYNLYDRQHLDYQDYAILTQSNNPQKISNINLGLNDLDKFPYNATRFGNEGSEPYGRVYSRKLFEYEILSNRNGGTSSIYTKALYEIKPTCNLDEVESYTYFNQPYGIYYYPVIKYTPAYLAPLNQKWDVTTQQFISSSTWKYGERYILNDVVYQNVTKDSFGEKVVSEEVLKTAKAGNKKYYVFKTKPEYRDPGDGTFWNADSVPSYLPPSLDNENWRQLRFAPIVKLEPRRIIFELFTVSDPSLNNFLTTTVDVNRIIDVPNRYVSIVSIGNILPNGRVQGDTTLNNISALFAVQTTKENLRIRLYRTATARDADINRDIFTIPTPDAGVLLDKSVGQAGVSYLVNSITTLIAGNTPPQGRIYYTIDNLDSTTKIATQLILYYFVIQVERTGPFGYLRKHYRFYRDNATATKRRNYVGCKNTIDTTIDGLPPVQIFVGEGTELNILPSSTSNEIIVGGGGTLNVT